MSGEIRAPEIKPMRISKERTANRRMEVRNGLNFPDPINGESTNVPTSPKNGR